MMMIAQDSVPAVQPVVATSTAAAAAAPPTAAASSSSKRRARPANASGIVAANAATAMASLTFDPADIGVPAQTADGAQMPPFLVKLWHLVLMVPKDVARWAPDGSRFEVLKPKAFSEHVLHEFRGEGASTSADALLRVMNTFTRQLHFYSFRRNELHEAGYASGAWAFQHPSFVEGHPEKLAFIRRFSRASDRDRLDPQLAAAYAPTGASAAAALADGPSSGKRPSRASARRARKRVARYDESSDEEDADVYASEQDSDDDGDVTDAVEDDESEYGGYGTRGRKSSRRAPAPVPVPAPVPAPTTATTATEKRARVSVAPVPSSPPVAREPDPHQRQHVGPAPEPFWVVSEAPSGVRLHDEMPSLGYLSEDLMNPADDAAGIAADADHERVLRRFLTETEFAPLVTPKAVGSISWSALPSAAAAPAQAAPVAKRAPVLDSSFGWFPDGAQQWPTNTAPTATTTPVAAAGPVVVVVPPPVSRSTSVVVPGEDLDLVVEALK